VIQISKRLEIGLKFLLFVPELCVNAVHYTSGVSPFLPFMKGRKAFHVSHESQKFQPVNYRRPVSLNWIVRSPIHRKKRRLRTIQSSLWSWNSRTSLFQALFARRIGISMTLLLHLPSGSLQTVFHIFCTGTRRSAFSCSFAFV